MSQKSQSKSEAIASVQEKLEQAKIDGNTKHVNIWQAVLNRLKADMERDKKSRKI